MEKKNTMLLTVIAVATLLVAVVGATFAYFNVTGSGSSTTAIKATTQVVGAVSLATGTGLSIELTGVDMSQTTAGDTGKTYYFVPSTDTTNKKLDSKPETSPTLATATITGGGVGINYLCTATVSVASTGDLGSTGIAELFLEEKTDKGGKILYTGSSSNLKTVDLYSGAIVSSPAANSTTFTATFQLTSTAASATSTGDVFNITGYATYKNLTTEQPQANISTNLVIDNFTCNTVSSFS